MREAVLRIGLSTVNLWTHTTLPMKNFTLREALFNRKLRLRNLRMNAASLYVKVSIVVAWLARVFNPGSPVRTTPLQKLILRLDKIRLTRGVDAWVVYCKSTRSALLHYLAEDGIRVKGIGLTAKGWPIILGHEQQEGVRGSYFQQQLLLTILFSTRGLALGKGPDTETITADHIRGIDCNCQGGSSFWTLLGYPVGRSTLPKRLLWNKFHLSTKRGPNGQALCSSLLDALILPDTQIENLGIVGGQDLLKRIKDFRQMSPLFGPIFAMLGFALEGPLLLRKLAWFPDKETKVRVIAIGDYWSQTALRPFHSYCFGILRKIPQDCTFNQGAFAEKIKDWEVLHSVDLTAFTDRFPIQLIQNLFSLILPLSFMKAWRFIMVHYPFHHGESEIHYKVGTPMGMYSSWSASTVAHHFVMFQSCRSINMDWQTAPYAMLGDDVVIGSTQQAEAYKRRLTEQGVSWSPEKTYSSSKLCEFAKRQFYNGVEVTPFPFSGLAEVTSASYLMTNFLQELSRKGWVSVKSIPETVASFYSAVLGRPRRNVRTIQTTAEICACIIQIMQNRLPAGESLTRLAGQQNYSFPTGFTDSIAQSILANIAVENFADSNPTGKETSGRPQGLLAENFLIYQTGVDAITDPIAAIESIPILQVYGLVEEEYLRQSKSALMIDRNGGDWPLLLRAMTLPLSDQVFVVRSDRMVPRASYAIGLKLRDRFDQIEAYPQQLSF